MAYIKLAKAGTAFDIISADDIISCKLDSGNIVVAYVLIKLMCKKL